MMYFGPDWRPTYSKGECMASPHLDRSHLRMRQEQDGSHTIWLHPGTSAQPQVFIGRLAKPEQP